MIGAFQVAVIPISLSIWRNLKMLRDALKVLVLSG